MLEIVAGSTSNTIYVHILDSTVGTGAGKTGLVYNSSGLVGYYTRTKAAPSTITLITQTATGAYSSGGFVEVDSAKAPGWYRLDIPDAACATNAAEVIVTLSGATGMVQYQKEIMLTTYATAAEIGQQVEDQVVDGTVTIGVALARLLAAVFNTCTNSPAGTLNLQNSSGGGGGTQVISAAGRTTTP